ncbi:MAG: deoxyhypusine synthase family protein, partial [Candidatus Nitrosotenuis sp.]
MIEPGNPVKDFAITEQTTFSQIFEQMARSGGFESRNLADGVEILSTMISDKNCLRFLSFVGAIVSTGIRGIIKDMTQKKWFDVIITTCGALDHDIARHFSNYKEGSFTMDDAQLADQDIHRLGNVLVPMESYGPLIEEKMQQILEDAYKQRRKEMSTADITNEIGK